MKLGSTEANRSIKRGFEEARFRLWSERCGFSGKHPAFLCMRYQKHLLRLVERTASDLCKITHARAQTETAEQSLPGVQMEVQLLVRSVYMERRSIAPHISGCHSLLSQGSIDRHGMRVHLKAAELVVLEPESFGVIYSFLVTSCLSSITELMSGFQVLVPCR